MISRPISPIEAAGKKAICGPAFVNAIVDACADSALASAVSFGEYPGTERRGRMIDGLFVLNADNGLDRSPSRMSPAAQAKPQSPVDRMQAARPAPAAA